MTLDEWLETIPEDERETLCVADGWKAGATAMLNELIKWGYIAEGYEGTARKEVEDILGEP